MDLTSEQRQRLIQIRNTGRGMGKWFWFSFICGCFWFVACVITGIIRFTGVVKNLSKNQYETGDLYIYMLAPNATITTNDILTNITSIPVYIMTTNIDIEGADGTKVVNGNLPAFNNNMTLDQNDVVSVQQFSTKALFISEIQNKWTNLELNSNWDPQDETVNGDFYEIRVKMKYPKITDTGDKIMKFAKSMPHIYGIADHKSNSNRNLLMWIFGGNSYWWCFCCFALSLGSYAGLGKKTRALAGNGTFNGKLNYLTSNNIPNKVKEMAMKTGSMFGVNKL